MITTDHYSRVRPGDQVDTANSLKCHGRPMTTFQPEAGAPSTHSCVICDACVVVDNTGRIADIRND